ncbi:hypothetical protein FZC35_01500 [Candidatus Cytomitobacter indipagum]|uniref:Uncharacterized protein n=1 Tax=Candidatus Cytomitobacter indipagum TaxID=2601575 RepID=A0A5C0UDD1_9PROT|nr:hypothetical protein [Candidatus Cytomitobacter indipagum]QEK38046.1 hypothetical protein FZC35_01500 [Candidatus Cytomitobacter indipagum]
MSILFFASENEINASDLKDEDKYSNKVDLIKISQNVNSKAKAEIHVSLHDIEIIEKIKHCAIAYNNKVVFLGSIVSKRIDKISVIISMISDPKQEDIEKAFELDPINEIFNPSGKHVNDVLLFDSQKRVFNLNKHDPNIYHLALDDDKIYSKEYNIPSNNNSFECNVNIRWNEHEMKMIDVMNSITSYISREAVSKIKKNMPKKAQRFGKYIVSNSYMRDGRVFITLKKEQKRSKSEAWKMNFNIDNIKDFNINLNGDKYIAQYKAWKEEEHYLSRDKVLLNNKIYQCISAHKSGDFMDRKNWVVINEKSFVGSSQYGCNLFDSDAGQDIFQQLLKLINCYVSKNAYKYSISISGPAEYWSFIETMDKIKFKDIHMQEKYAYVFSYEKIFQNNKNEVRFKLHFNEYKQPDKNEKINYVAENYFCDNYVDMNSIKQHGQFLIERIYGEDYNLPQCINKTKIDFERDFGQIVGLKIIDNANYDHHFNELRMNLYKSCQNEERRHNEYLR